MIDGDLIDRPYYNFLTNAKTVPFLGGMNDGDALSFAPSWITTPLAGNFSIYDEYAESLTIERGLTQVIVRQVQENNEAESL